MRSLQQFSESKLNYFNNIEAACYYNTMPLNESALVMTHGKSIDSILYKLDLCAYRSTQDSIFENYDDALFTIDEQYAARDMLLVVCKEWLDSICEEYGLEIQISEGDETASGVKGYLEKIRNAAKEKAEQFKDGLKELGEKLKAVKEFIQNILSKAITGAKELADKFLDLMDSIKETLGKVFERIGGKVDEIQKEFSARVEEVIKNKSKRPKESIYESIQNDLLSEDSILEWSLFGKKKNKEEKKPSKNEYDQSIEGGSGSSGADDEKKASRRKLILSILKNVAISVAVLILIPALVGCAWGPAVGLVAATIAKALMSGIATWKLLKSIRDTIKSGKFKAAKPWKKFGYILLWVCSFGLIAWGASKFMKDFGTIYDAVAEGNFKSLVPDETVQKGMSLINKLFKSLSGKDTPGWEELQDINANGLVKWEHLGETETHQIEPNQVGPEETKNIQQVIDDTQKGVSATDWTPHLKDHFDEIKGSLEQGYTYATGNVKFTGGIQAVLKTPAGQEFLAQYKDLFEYIPVKSSNAAGTTYSCLLMFKNGTPGTEEAVEAFSQLLKDAGNGSATILGSTGVATETVSLATQTVVPAAAGGFAPVMAIPAMFKNKVNKGFLLRLGSSRSGNNIYAIQENGIKGMKFSDVKSKYSNLNSEAIKAMSDAVNKNYKVLEESKKKLEEKKDLSKEEKKQLKGLTEQLEKMKDNISNENYECVVFFSEVKVEAQNPQEGDQKNEGLKDWFKKDENPEKKEIEYQPVMFINPLCMACADLANIRKGGTKAKPRSKPIYLKGLFASYEFLPGKEGMSEKDLNELLKNITLECLKAAWNMTADAPAIKEGKKKYVENDKSIYKGKKRKDFGNFTNTEITEILNDPSSVTKYMSGANSDRSTVEKENTDFQKDRKAKAKEEWKNNIENDEEVKEIIQNSRSLRKNLLDDNGKVKPEALDELTDVFLRMETSYGKDQSRKGLWGKIKGIFTKDDKVNKKYDSEAVQKLAYKLASLHKKKISKRVKNESLDIEELEYLDEAMKYIDMHIDDILSEEFINYINTDEIFEENILDSIELISE